MPKVVRGLLALQILVAAYIAYQVAFRGSHNHYLIFTTAGRCLLQGQNPYGVEFGLGGLWFYSPLCGWLFGLLGALPEKWGCAIYIFGSYLLLLEGCRRFVRSLGVRIHENLFLSLAIVLSTGEIIGGLQSCKLEIAMVGVLLILVDLIDRRPKLSAALAALLINAKWFPLAPLGLLALSEIRQRRWKFVAWTPVFLGVWFLLPVLVYGWTFAKELYVKQNEALGPFVVEVYADFPNVFGLLKHTFHVVVPERWVSGTLGGAALVLIAAQWRISRSPEARAFALALGSLYIVSFNLLSQFNAYALATPALLLALAWAMGENKPRRVWYCLGTMAYWILVSYVYSDLVPHAFRDGCREAMIKPLGALILLAVFLGDALASGEKPAPQHGSR